jgi:hypothetical protein
MAGEHAGRSIIERLWEASTAQYGVLMDLHEEEAVTTNDLKGAFQDGGVKNAEEYAEHAVLYLQTQGKLQGLAFALSIMLDPYTEDRKVAIEEVKAQVRDQWNAAQEEEEDE